MRLRGDVMIAAVCRRDREDAVGRRAGRRVPRLRGGLAVPRRRTAASRTCASSASRPRARSCSGTSARSGCGSRRAGNFIHTAFSEGKRDAELDRAHARRARRGARVDPDLGGRPGELVPRREGDRQRRRDRTAASAGASRGRRTGPTSSSMFASLRRRRWRGRASEVLDLVRDLPRALLRARDRRRGVRDRARRGDRRGASARRRARRRRTRRSSARRPERDVTRWFSDASVLTRYGIATVNYGTSTGLLDTGVKGEPRDRRARADRGGLRSGRDEGLRSDVSIYQLPADLPVPVDDGACRPPARHARSPRLTLESSQGPVEHARASELDLAALYVYPRTGSPRPADAGRLGRDPRRTRLHAAVVRLSRSRLRAGRSSAPACAGPLRADPRRTGGARRAGRAHALPVIADPELRARRCACLYRPSSSRAPKLYKRVTLVLDAATRSRRSSTRCSRPTGTWPRWSRGWERSPA